MLQILKNLIGKKPSKKEYYQKILDDIQLKKANLSKDHKEYKAYEKIESKINRSMAAL